MIFRIAFISIVLTTTLSGCAKLQSTAMSFTEGSTGRVFLWHPDYSAGIGKDDKLCIQGALTARGRSGNADLEVPIEGMTTQAKAKYVEALTKLNPSTAQTTYANNAFFAICQLALNEDDITAEHILQMFKITSDTALEITQKTNPNDPITAGELSWFEGAEKVQLENKKPNEASLIPKPTTESTTE